MFCARDKCMQKSWAHFISASYRLDFRGRFGALVSAPQNPVSRQLRLVLAETSTAAR